MCATPLIRSELEARFPEAFKSCHPRKHDTISTGISEVDLATGGIPVSTLSEICGSGKTSVLTSLLAHASHEHYCALVDGKDSFDPASADAAGANLSRLLWVRCGKSKQKLPPLEQAFAIADILLNSGGFGLVAVDLGDFSGRLLNKIEPAIWFRFARYVEKQRTALVFIEEQHHARSAGLVINLKTKYSPQSGTLFKQLEFEAELIRTTEKKLPNSVRPTFGRKFGIEVGMTKLQVETCGSVTLRKRALDSEDAAQIALVNCGHSFSPRVESTCVGTVILDLSGTEKLFGTSENTACKISATGAEQGFELRVAVAANPDTAMYAARGYAGITIIPPHQEAERLASLNVQLLPATPETLEILDGWGIQTFKALAALPEIPLTQRLGQSGLYLQKLAQGRIKRTLVPVEIASTFVESYEFDDPVELLESLAFLLHRLIQQITERLMSHSLATNELRLTLDLGVTQLFDGSKSEQYKREWKLSLPTQDKNMLFSVVRLDLEHTTLTAPV